MAFIQVTSISVWSPELLSIVEYLDSLFASNRIRIWLSSPLLPDLPHYKAMAVPEYYCCSILEHDAILLYHIRFVSSSTHLFLGSFPSARKTVSEENDSERLLSVKPVKCPMSLQPPPLRRQRGVHSLYPHDLWSSNAVWNASHGYEIVSCTNCSKRLYGDDYILWTTCNHSYCENCALKVINESLSFMNRVPTCIHANCNEPLGPHLFQTLSELSGQHVRLSPKYQFKRNELRIASQYKQQELLLYGYIRTESEHSHFPMDVMWIIFDYLHLMIYTLTGCTHCDSTGEELVPCYYGCVRGYLIDCNRCSGMGVSGKPICNPCTKCSGKGTFEFQCRQCHGTHRLVTTCSQCIRNGTQSVMRKNCVFCNGSGVYERPCVYCKGPSLAKSITCHECRGFGYTKTPATCSLCNGSGRNKRVVAVLDFKMLCNKQTLCTKCGLFSPNDLIMFWSRCNHAVCWDCVCEYFRFGLKAILYCPAAECNEELIVERLAISHPIHGPEFAAKIKYELEERERECIIQ